MRRLGVLTLLACASIGFAGEFTARAQKTAATCAGRVSRSTSASIRWFTGPIEDVEELDEWCRGVGPAVLVPTPVKRASTTAPSLRDVVVVSWNAHLADGELDRLVAALRSGQLTGGRPTQHFVLLIQELFRRGPDVPAFAPDARSAFAIKARNPRAPDVWDHAQALGLSTLYVPSMRNGADLLEDRGNAILSTEPLSDAFALELPFERQRRVAIGAAVQVRTAAGLTKLHVVNTHLEPLSSPKSLWVFRNPRRRQVAAILDLLRSPRFADARRDVGTVVGGDFNTIQGGMEEEAYIQARAWSTSLVTEDKRSTHHMGRIDYLFFRLAPGWTASSTRVDEKFGSDHHPVLGRFAPDGRRP